MPSQISSSGDITTAASISSTPIKVNSTSTSNPYSVNIDLGSPLTFALAFSRYGTLNNFIYYYMSGDGEIRVSLVNRDKSGSVSVEESQLYGYAPVEISNYDPTKCLMMGLTSMGNIDNSLYALVETCS